MLNKAKVLKYEIWDGETGEADVVAEFSGKKKLKAFTLDHFADNKDYEVILSLFCKEYQVTSQVLRPEIINTDDKYQVDLQGLIIKVNSDEEEGEVITVDAGNILVNVYISAIDPEIIQPADGLFFKGNGRLDIELEQLP